MIKYIFGGIIAVIIAALVSHYYHSSELPDVNWEMTVIPGDLSEAHSFLEDDCQSCHTPITGVTRENCVVCHANDTQIIQRQPTLFHVDIAECNSCHMEHQGKAARISKMDHEALSDIGLRMLPEDNTPFDQGTAVQKLFKEMLTDNRKVDPLLINSHVSTKEALLNCATCHANDDRHFGLFSDDCVQCHNTEQWSLSSFVHPSNKSNDCNQCHEAPPSHYMKHFRKISAKVAGEHKAPVEECFACHQNTSWNDIKKAGWYKHH